ncbi:MAG: ABC transporter substrate-binding protein [Betaproteobacteria bacterium]|nr:ABC transporter substrate-binding protein [Betaproteobacteria bacterium]MBI2958989.1 ABC transporter substrate-binding protein [Betaproteobacteria bacterium]
MRNARSEGPLRARRKLLLALGSGVLAAPFASFAQQPPAKIARIGFLGPETPARTATRVGALRAGLRDLGYVEGKNLAFEFRWAEGKNERLPELASELVREKVDVIVTHGGRGGFAAKRATAAIPIIVVVAGDAVAIGLVASLARPGGNVTGSTFFALELYGKRLEFLKEAFPRIRRIAFLVNPDNPTSAPAAAASVRAAKALKLELQPFQTRGPSDFERAFSAMAQNRFEAVSVTQDPIFVSNTGAIASLAAKYRLASIGGTELAQAGGLMGYGVNLVDLFRRGAHFVDKILKGAKPADLPVERPTKFEFIINRKTANALGVSIPQSILMRADEVID